MTNGNDAMTCAGARELLSAVCDGEAERTPELAAHLGSCDACREFADRIGALSAAFAPLRAVEPPESVAARVVASVGGGGDRRRPALIHATALRRATALRIAAGLLGLASIGAVGFGLSARTATATSESEAGWLEPLAGRALHPADASLRSWSEAMGIVMNGDRR